MQFVSVTYSYNIHYNQFLFKVYNQKMISQQDFFAKSQKVFPSIEQIYDLDTTELSQLRNRIATTHSQLNQDYKQELLCNIDLELEQRKTLQFFSLMHQQDNPYLKKMNNFKDQFVKLAQITIENRNIGKQTQQLHDTNSKSSRISNQITLNRDYDPINDQKDVHSQYQNHQTASICSKDIDSRSVQVNDKKMNLHRGINTKNKKTLNQFILKTLVKSKVNQFYVITKNNHLSNSINKNQKGHHVQAPQFKKTVKLEIKNKNTDKAKQKQLISGNMEKIKQIRKKMEQKPNPQKSQGSNNKKIVDMIREEENIRLQKIKDRQKKEKEKYKSESQIQQIKKQNQNCQFWTSNAIEQQITIQNVVIHHQSSKQIIQHQLQTNKTQQIQILTDIRTQTQFVQELIDCQQQQLQYQSSNRDINLPDQIQETILQEPFNQQQKKSNNTLANHQQTIQKYTINTSLDIQQPIKHQQIHNEPILNQKIDTSQKQQQPHTEKQRQNSQKQSLLKAQPDGKQQYKQLTNAQFDEKGKQSIKKRQIKQRENKECYNQQYWVQIREEAQLRLKRFKIQKQLAESQRKNSLMKQIKQEQIKQEQIKQEQIKQEVIMEDVTVPSSQYSEGQMVQKKVEIVRQKPKLNLPKKIRNKPEFDYLKIFPSFDHLFSIMYMKQSGSLDIPSVMKDISSIFTIHLDKIKNQSTNFPTIFFPLDCPSNNFSTINPRNLIHHTEQTFVDLKKMVERIEIFNHNINGQYRPHRQTHQEKQQQTKYYRVIKTKEEVYDIISTSFLRRRGWRQLPHGCSMKTTWNLFWSWGKPDLELGRLLTVQKINHFPYNKNLSRKDLLYKNLDSFRKNLKIPMPFLPITFTLPKQFSQFSSKFHQESISSAYNYWIMKPIGKSRGRGIKVITNLSELSYVENIVVQKYISNPLLIEGYKFDMRIYVLVTSFHPLEVFVYREGFARFSTEKFTLDPNQIKNTFVHLTNFAINRQNQDAKQQQNNPNSISFSSGSKISLKNLKQKLTSLGYNYQNIWSQVHEIIVKSLLACSVHVPIFPSSFQLFGYDIMIDDTGTCHLIEINSSPSLERAYMVDEVIKQALIDDIIDIVNPPTIDKHELLNVISQRLGAKKKCSLDDDLIDLGRVLKQAPIRKIGQVPQNLGLFEVVAPCLMSRQIEKNIKSRSGANNMHNID